MPDPVNLPHSGQVNIQNVPDTGIFAGLGQYRSLVAFGFAGIGGFLLLYFAHELVSQGHSDRTADRALFRDAVNDIQRRADERAGEVKGSTDKLVDVVRENSNFLRQWIDESRRDRLERGRAPGVSEPKATPP